MLRNRTFILDFCRIYTLLFVEFGWISMFCPCWVCFLSVLYYWRDQYMRRQNHRKIFSLFTNKCCGHISICTFPLWSHLTQNGFNMRSVFWYSFSVEHPVVYLGIVGKTMESNQSISLNNFNSCRIEVQLSTYYSISGKVLRGCKKLWNSK